MKLPEVDPQISSDDRKSIAVSLGQAVDGSGSKFLKKFFGCQTCPLKQNGECPHGLKGKEKHSNGICSYRTNQLKALYDETRSPVKLFQRDNLVKSQVLLDHFRNEFAESGNLHPMYHQLERNVITLSDKMRKVDEGIKVHADVSIHDDIRRTIRQQMVITDAEFRTKEKDQVRGSSFFKNSEVPSKPE